jgi:hypothetical protein
MAHNVFRNRRDLGSQLYCSQVITQDYRRNYPNTEIPLITFKTSKSTGFFGEIARLSGTGLAKWDMGDGTIQNSNSFIYNYADTTTKTVNIYLGTLIGETDITSLRVYSDLISGTLNLSRFNGLVDLQAYSNASLSSVIYPTNSTSLWTNISLYSTGLSGIQDLSNIDIAGTFQIYSIAGVTGILHKVTSRTFSTYYVSNNNMTGTHDVSMLTGWGGDIRGNGNVNLTTLVCPTSSTIISIFWWNGCNLGYLDISGLLNIGGNFQVQTNPNCQYLTLPTTINRQFTTFNASGCSLDVTSVDAVFSKLNTWYTANPPTANLTINLSGGTNAALTGGLANPDLVSLNNIFTTAGRILFATFN